MGMKKRITAMLIRLMMITGLIAASATATMAQTPATPVTTAHIDVEKLFYSVNSGAELPETRGFSWTITKVGYQSAFTAVTGTVDDVMDPVSGDTTTTSVVQLGNTNQYMATVRLEGAYSSKTGRGTIDIKIQNDPSGTKPTRPGVYTYTIQENNSGVHDVTYDPDVYYINIYVTNVYDENDNNKITGETTISNITAWKGDKNTTAGTPDGNSSDVAAGDIVDGGTYDPSIPNVTPGGTWDTESATIEGNTNPEGYGDAAVKSAIVSTPDADDARAMTLAYPFTNSYTGNNETTTRYINVSKSVEGNYANPNAIFDFPVSLYDTGSAAPFGVVYYKNNGTESLTEEELNALYGGSPITEVPNSSTTRTTLKLKDGYTFQLTGITATTQWNISEDTAAGYTQTAYVTAGFGLGQYIDSQSGTYFTADRTDINGLPMLLSNNSTVNTAIGRTGYQSQTALYLLSDDAYSEVATADNWPNGTTMNHQIFAAGTAQDICIEYVNTRDYVVPTGLHITMLPYVITIGMAFVGLILFIIMRKKKANTNAGL